MTGLLLTGVSAAESVDHHQSPPSAPLGTPVPTVKLAEVAVSRYTGAINTGMRLLGQAATAARMVSYRGVQIVSWLTAGGSGTWLGRAPVGTRLNVLHQTGEPPDGVLGLTPTLVGLLTSHYAVLYTGQGTAAGRPASIVEVLRPDGSVAALFWLDKATALPLRRELFNDQARVISVCGFAGLTVRPHPLALPSRPERHPTAGPSRPERHPAAGPSRPDRHPAAGPSRPDRHPAAGPSGPAAAEQVTAGQAAVGLASSGQAGAVDGQAGAASSARPWTDRLGAGQLAALRAHGWPAPAAMPGDLTLFHASESVTPTGRVVDLAYSDGLSVVSLFVQRGRLPAALPGWRRTDLSGHPLFLRNPAEPDLTWSADGYVYTVVAAAPSTILARVVDSLPHQSRPGFWTRMGRGVRRLLSWANPFG